MRKKEREVLDFGEMLKIADACSVCRIGLQDGDAPYIVPLNFGYEERDGGLVLYFHGAKEGKKLSLIKKNGGAASFEMDCGHGLLQSGEIACTCSWHYQSVIGRGNIEILEDPQEKEHGLRLILSHYGAGKGLPMNPEHVGVTCVLRMTVSEWTCKRHEA